MLIPSCKRGQKNFFHDIYWNFVSEFRRDVSPATLVNPVEFLSSWDDLFYMRLRHINYDPA